MLYIPHPLVQKIEQEYNVLKSLISELPSLYKSIADQIEKRAEAEAEIASNGDREVYLTVYHSYDSALEFVSEVPTNANGYLLAAIYPMKAFLNCNIPVEENRKLFEQIDLIRLVRDNQSHGMLNTNEEMEKIRAFVSRYEGLMMIDNVV